MAKKDMTAGGKYTNAFYRGALDLHGSIEKVWDEMVLACLGNNGACKDKSHDFRKYIINKGAIGIVTAYTTYEMGAAVAKAAAGNRSDVEAPYNWDEAAAFYIGNIKPALGNGRNGTIPGNLYSPYEFNWKRDADFPDGVSTHEMAIPILNEGLLSLRSSSYDAAKVERAQTAMYKIFAIAAIRSALKYSKKAHDGGENGAFSEKYLAEGWAYWRSASGWMSTVDKTKVQEIDGLLSLSLTEVPADTPCQIKTKVESMYAGLGITCAMVGAWKGAPDQHCLKTACSDSSTEKLPTGSDAYVDMCQAEDISGAAPAAWRATWPAVAAAAAAFVWSRQ